jgi:hypothetical protein
LHERSQDGEIFRNYDNAVRVPAKCVAIMNNFSECDVLVVATAAFKRISVHAIRALLSATSGTRNGMTFVAAVTLAVAAWR